MPESNETTADVKRLRFIFAINHFKSLVLGDTHIAGKHQSGSVLEAIAPLFAAEPFSDRAWEKWFSGSKTTNPQEGTINALDEVAAHFIYRDQPLQLRQEVASKGFFRELVRGGLLSNMTARTKSKDSLNTLIARANSYQPLTPIHLHFDAIEVAAWGAGFQDVPWDFVTKVAAQRIQEILAQRWSPRQGRLYAEFSSDFRHRWDAADEEERAKIKASHAGVRPNPFDRLMAPGARPDWSKVGCDADIAPSHIYKLLFALPADPQFLAADRLEAWALDLATASLAMHAMAWADRYSTMGHRIYDEKLFWIAFDRIYLDPQPVDHDGRELRAAMERCRASWSRGSVGRFNEARQFYHNLLSEGGISPQEVRRCAMAAAEKHPLIYYGAAVGAGR